MRRKGLTAQKETCPVRLIVCTALALALALPAVARPLTADEAKTLDHAVQGYLDATRGNDAEALVRAIPPRILNVFAGSAGIEARKLTRTLQEQTQALTKGLTVRKTSADESALDAQDAKLDDGTPVVWVVVPTTYEAEKDGRKTQNAQSLVAIREADAWYFVRIDGAQQKQMATLAYPFLAAATVPDPVITPVN
jgi:hypothetical protein